MRTPLASPEEPLVARNHMTPPFSIFEVRQPPTANPSVNVLLLRIKDIQRE
ncbi:hypothetical protein BH10PSE16_BH10PSE16_20540 [soil metagenome]